MSTADLPPGVAANAGSNKTLEYIIDKAFLQAQKTCSSPWVLSFATTLPGLTIKFHELITILAAVACLFNCVCAIYLMTGHVLFWVRPAEQRQILRIILFDVVLSVSAFFSTYFYISEGYVHPLAIYYEGFAMTAIFLLLVQYACPDPYDRAQYFTNLERHWVNGKVKKGSKGSLRWFRMIWILVYQVTFTRIGTVIAQEVLNGLTCPLSSVRSHGSIAIQVIQGLSTWITVTAIIVFEKRMHYILSDKGHRPILKLFSFKFIVGLESLQAILFSVLAEKGIYFPKPPYHVSWADFAIGVPQLVLSYELVFVSILFMWSYTFEPYRALVLEGHQVTVPSWKAFSEGLDLTDIWAGFKYAFTCFTKSTYLEGSVDGRFVHSPTQTDGHASGDEPLQFKNGLPEST